MKSFGITAAFAGFFALAGFPGAASAFQDNHQGAGLLEITRANKQQVLSSGKIVMVLVTDKLCITTCQSAQAALLDKKWAIRFPELTVATEDIGLAEDVIPMASSENRFPIIIVYVPGLGWGEIHYEFKETVDLDGFIRLRLKIAKRQQELLSEVDRQQNAIADIVHADQGDSKEQVLTWSGLQGDEPAALQATSSSLIEISSDAYAREVVWNEEPSLVLHEPVGCTSCWAAQAFLQTSAANTKGINLVLVRPPSEQHVGLVPYVTVRVAGLPGLGLRKFSADGTPDGENVSSDLVAESTFDVPGFNPGSVSDVESFIAHRLASAQSLTQALGRLTAMKEELHHLRIQDGADCRSESACGLPE
jgi:hypothetical protein